MKRCDRGSLQFIYRLVGRNLFVLRHHCFIFFRLNWLDVCFWLYGLGFLLRRHGGSKRFMNKSNLKQIQTVKAGYL